MLRWWRNWRADRAAWKAMTPLQRQVYRGLRVPPRMAGAALTGGTYQNAERERSDWIDRLLSPPEPRREWPRRPGVEPISVSHTAMCEVWPLSGRGCVPECRAPDRRRPDPWLEDL